MHLALSFYSGTTLNQDQQTALQTLIKFIDEHMWKSSKEKRALAMKLNVKLLSIIPAEFIPIILSKSMIKSIYSARAKKQNLLYDYVGTILQEIVASAGKLRYHNLV